MEYSPNIPRVNKVCQLSDLDRFKKVVSGISQESNPVVCGSESGPSHVSDLPNVTPFHTLHGTWEMGLRECQLEGNWPLRPIIENGDRGGAETCPKPGMVRGQSDLGLTLSSLTLDPQSSVRREPARWHGDGIICALSPSGYIRFCLRRGWLAVSSEK